MLLRMQGPLIAALCGMTAETVTARPCPFVISRYRYCRGIVEILMTPSPKTYSPERAPRIKLSGSVLAMLGLSNGQHVRGTLHQLSVTGGLIQLTEPLDATAAVEVVFHLGSTTVRAKAAMLFPVWATQGCLQPFRFTEMAQETRKKLSEDVKRLLSGARNEHSPASHTSSEPQDSEDTREVEASNEPTKVSLYFESPADALRFTVAISSVISAESRESIREDFLKLSRAISNISRVTTKGVLNGNGHHVEARVTSPLTAAS